MHHDGAKWRQCRDRGFQLSHGGRRVECHVPSSCARRRSSKSSSNSVKIAGTCLLSSWQRRFRRAARKDEKIAMQDVPASRLSNMHRSGGAIYNLDLLPEANRLNRLAVLLLRGEPSRADVSCSSSFPSTKNRTLSVDGDVNERSSRELPVARRGRLSSSTRPFRRRIGGHRGLAWVGLLNYLMLSWREAVMVGTI